MATVRFSDISTCPTCGPQERMEFDAASLLERAFEGVMFDITADQHGGIVIAGQKKDADYLEDFNMPKLLKQAVEGIEQGELMVVYCPKCKEPLE